MAKKYITRRTMLRGLAGGTSVAVGLPLLDAMLNTTQTALADGSALPLRFMSYYWADGVIIDRFEPDQTGGRWELSEQLAPLLPVKSYINLLTGLQNHSPERVTHHEGMAVFNGYPFEISGALATDAGGPTIDQLIADALGDVTPVRSVHVRVSKRDSTDGDGGTTALAMSHRGTPGNLTPQVPQENPQLVWQTLFGEFVSRPDDRQLRTSILDHVREDAASLRAKLGARDRSRLDAHLEGVRELENKILAAPPACSLPEMPTETNTDTGGEEPISAVTQVMAELLAYAFVCDLTRVATFLFKKFVSGTVFDEINANEIHHNASHDGWESDIYHQGIVYQMTKLSEVLQILHGTQDVDGTSLLDTMIVYASTDCSTGASHSIERQPIILAGTGRGYLVHPGLHLQATPWNGNHEEPNAAGNTSDALLTCLQAFDPDATEVGGDELRSETPMSEVVAV